MRIGDEMVGKAVARQLEICESIKGSVVCHLCRRVVRIEGMIDRHCFTQWESKPAGNRTVRVLELEILSPLAVVLCIVVQDEAACTTNEVLTHETPPVLGLFRLPERSEGGMGHLKVFVEIGIPLQGKLRG